MLTSTSRCRLRAAGLQARFKHTVRVILTDNVGEKQSGEVLHVSAGYARNKLIPKKLALYAIAQNFDRLGRKDPDIETDEERRQRLIQMAADEANVDLVAANILEKYLRNKHVSGVMQVGRIMMLLLLLLLFSAVLFCGLKTKHFRAHIILQLGYNLAQCRPRQRRSLPWYGRRESGPTEAVQAT